MQYRKLGSSDLIVSEIALGSWLTYSGGVDKDRSIACSNGPSTLASRCLTRPTSMEGAPMTLGRSRIRIAVRCRSARPTIGVPTAGRHPSAPGFSRAECDWVLWESNGAFQLGIPFGYRIGPSA